MRVALLSRNARTADAIGQQVAAKVFYFQQLGAQVRLYLSETESLRPDCAAVKPVQGTSRSIWGDAVERDYLLTCDLVVAEYGAAYDLINLLPSLYGHGPRVVVDYRGVTPIELGDTGLQSELERAASQRALLWCADAVIAQSRFAANELCEAIGLPRERVYQLPCWMASAGSTDERLVVELRKRHGLAGKQVLLFVGRLARNKQPEQVIQALPRLTASVHAVFVGCQNEIYQEQLQHCNKLADELGVAERVHFLGSASDSELSAWYRTADVLVLPSLHECFGMPVVEAMMRGLPVVASDAGSLPEVLGHAGLTAGVSDATELAEQIERYLVERTVAPLCRVALVTHRFGTEFAGGAEKSLRLMAQTLQTSGYQVEVFTTCNTAESRWSNTLPAGTRTEDGFDTHRFPIDAYDAERLGKAYEAIRQGNGKVASAVEEQYLEHSLRSKALIEGLKARRGEFAAIITGPYLFRLTYEVARQFREQVLLAPCFHDESLARLASFRKVYRQVGGLLFHSEEEARFAGAELAVNHPRQTVIGTLLGEKAFSGNAQQGFSQIGGPYLVYCGRCCPEKGVDRLLNYVEHLHRTESVGLKLVCIGQGPMKLPRKPWLVDLGFVSEETKRDVIAGATALVNLSRNESLSIVVLEAWALGVPVIADAGCAVVKDLVKRARGGYWVADRQEFVKVVSGLREDHAKGQALGKSGREFVRQHYASREQFAGRLDQMIRSLARPMREVANRAGVQRGAEYMPEKWSEKYSAILEQVQQSPTCEVRPQAEIQAIQPILSFPAGMESGTVTLRIANQGQVLLAAEGPAKVWLSLNVVTRRGRGKRLATGHRVRLSAAIMPGQEQLVVAAFDAPHELGKYRLRVRLMQGKQMICRCIVPMQVSRSARSSDDGQKATRSAGPLLQSARSALAQAKRLEQLPEEYLDVCEGKLAGIKRMLKRKLLNNFRKAYVDVAFRQQSALNERLIGVMSLFLETLSAQDNGATVAQMQRKLERLHVELKKERRVRRKLLSVLRNSSPSDATIMEGD